MQRSRPVLVALFAVLVEIVMIAAVDNQWSSRQLTEHVIRRLDKGSFAAHAASSALTLPWRFGPVGDDARTWSAQLAAVGVLLVLSYLLVLASAAGRPSSGQVFLASWFAVIVAAFSSVIVRGLIAPVRPAGSNRLTVAFFSYPGGEVFLFGAVLGLFVAIVALIGFVVMRVAGDGMPSPASAGQLPPGGQPGYGAPPGYGPPPDYPAETETVDPHLGGEHDTAELPELPHPREVPATGRPSRHSAAGQQR